MKNYMLFAALAAAFTLASCAKEAQVNDSDSAALRTVHFSTLPTESKTIFGDKSGSKYPVLWQEGDQICPSFNYASPSSDNYITVTPSADGSTASFKGDFAEAESYRFMFVSPAVRFKSINKTNKTVMFEFPSGQTSTAASPDPAAQILYADTGEITEIPTPVELEFSHMAAYFHLQFANVSLGEAAVQAVNITNGARYLAGRIFYNWESDSFEASTEFNTISVSTTTLTDVWCAVCPVDLSGGQLTIEVVTDGGTLTKTVNMPASANLPRGKVAKFTVDMAGVPLVSPVVYKAITSIDQLNVGDKVILAAAGEDEAYAMSTGQNTNNRSATGVTKTAETILNPTDAVEILDVEDGVIPGHFAFKATGADNPGYIYAANQTSSGSNILRTQATKDNSASWAVSVQDVTRGDVTWEKATHLFADIPSTGRGLIAFNATDKLFTAYGNGTSQQAVKLYRLDVPAVTTPRFNVTLPNGTSYSSSTQEIPVYVFGNVSWTASVTGGATLSKISGTGQDILTLTVPAVSQETTYTLTVTTGAEVAQTEFEFEVVQTKSIVAGDVLYWEYFDGADNLQSPVTYLASGKATTTVYGGASVTYSLAKGSGNTRAYNNDGVVYDGDYALYLPSSVTHETNLMVGMSGGWFKVAGIPCKGVATALLEYDSNNVPDEDRYASSPTTGVSLSEVSYDTYRSKANNKAIRHIKYTLTFDSSKNLETFTVQFNNTYSGNIRITNLKVTVLTVN